MRRRGFSLVELLLVIAIITIISAIAVPSFINSMRGNRLRTASRAIVSTGKYARSLAILNQKEMILTVDLDANVVMAHGYAYLREEGSAEPAAEDFAPEEQFDEDGNPIAPTDVAFSKPEVSRSLGRVRVRAMELNNEYVFNDGKCHAIYYPNGRCESYKVRLEDERGSSALVSVDNLSAVEVETNF